MVSGVPFGSDTRQRVTVGQVSGNDGCGLAGGDHDGPLVSATRGSGPNCGNGHDRCPSVRCVTA